MTDDRWARTPALAWLIIKRQSRSSAIGELLAPCQLWSGAAGLLLDGEEIGPGEMTILALDGSSDSTNCL